MIRGIVDFFDASRSNRPFPQSLAINHVRTIMADQENLSIDPPPLKRFVNLMGRSGVAHLVGLNADELAVVLEEHASDPSFRPQVTIVPDRQSERIGTPQIANGWERDDRGEHPRAVVEAINPDAIGFDPLTYL